MVDRGDPGLLGGNGRREVSGIVDDQVRPPGAYELAELVDLGRRFDRSEHVWEEEGATFLGRQRQMLGLERLEAGTPLGAVDAGGDNRRRIGVRLRDGVLEALQARPARAPPETPALPDRERLHTTVLPVPGTALATLSPLPRAIAEDAARGEDRNAGDHDSRQLGDPDSHLHRFETSIAAELCCPQWAAGPIFPA